MNGFTYYAPTKVYFGPGTTDKAGEYLRAEGASRVLLHYGSGSAERSGALEAVRASLRAAGIPFVELGGVVPNPRLSLVREGIALGLKEKVDFLLAVGGGSVIDSAKAISCGLGEPDKDVWDLFCGKRTVRECLPLGTVLTIAAAGSEMSNSCVINRDDTLQKQGCKSDLFRCRFAVMDPRWTLTLPEWQTMSGCADILMHTMERYFTSGGNLDLTDALAEGLMKTVMRHARVLLRDPENLESRAEIMWAGSLSHNGLTGCGNGGNDFASHALEHQLSGRYDVTHGAGLCAIWPSWARYVVEECTGRFEQFALRVMEVAPGESPLQTAHRGIDAMEAFFREIHMPVNLRELGLHFTEEEILDMAHACADSYGGKRGSAKVLYEEDMAAVYRLANA